jgi:hypothetical protein
MDEGAHGKKKVGQFKTKQKQKDRHRQINGFLETKFYSCCTVPVMFGDYQVYKHQCLPRSVTVMPALNT